MAKNPPESAPPRLPPGFQPYSGAGVRVGCVEVCNYRMYNEQPLNVRYNRTADS